MKEHTLTICMDYPGFAISKNGLWKGGNRRWGMNDEAKRWKLDLTESVQMLALIRHIRNPQPPVHVAVTGRFLDRANAPDLHNLGEICLDAVQDGLGIDDKHFTFSTSAPEFDGTRMPSIGITVSVMAEGQDEVA